MQDGQLVVRQRRKKKGALFEVAMMFNRDQIVALSLDVNDILSSYVRIHNYLFAPSFWRGIFRWFQFIDFDLFDKKVARLIELLSNIEVQLKSIKSQTLDDGDEYVVALHRYTVALLDTISALGVALTQLRGKAHGKKGYNMKAYKRDLNAYKRAEKKYHALAPEMNRLWDAFRQS